MNGNVFCFILFLDVDRLVFFWACLCVRLIFLKMTHSARWPICSSAFCRLASLKWPVAVWLLLLLGRFVCHWRVINNYFIYFVYSLCALFQWDCPHLGQPLNIYIFKLNIQISVLRLDNAPHTNTYTHLVYIVPASGSLTPFIWIYFLNLLFCISITNLFKVTGLLFSYALFLGWAKMLLLLNNKPRLITKRGGLCCYISTRACKYL